MSLTPVGVLPLSEQVYRQLLDAILGGEFIEGVLPSERELATTFGVNRHAIREAIKRLQQANLVEVSQGGATRLLDMAESARLDLMPDLLVRRGQIDYDIVLAVLEMRACIGADAARLCATRSPNTELRGHIDAARDAEGLALEQANRAFWVALIDGSKNVAYRLALNTLVAGLDATAQAPETANVTAMLHVEYRQFDKLEAIAAAIAASKPAAAERAAAAFLTPIAVSAGHFVE